MIDDDMRRQMGEYIDEAARGPEARVIVIEALCYMLMASGLVITLADAGVQLRPWQRATAIEVARGLRPK